MKILITNDDGYNAIGLKILVEKARKYGEVTVIAPMVEQSAMSHAIKVRGGFEYKKIDDFDNVTAYYINSTPADCVRFAYYGLKLDFDIIFSGINCGFNLGEDILYSGTVSAVFEAASIKKKAIAFSADRDSFSGADEYFDEALKYIFNNHLLDVGDLYNVNFPINCHGIKITKQGGCNFDTFFNIKEKEAFQLGNPTFEKDKDKLCLDTCCVMNDYVSITPLTSDRTNKEVYDLLMNKNAD